MTENNTEHHAAAEDAKRLVELLVMPDDLRMSAYYFEFDKTGVREIDEILEAVCWAGKGFHHTEYWNDPILCDGTVSYVELIQEKANQAAKKLKSVDA